MAYNPFNIFRRNQKAIFAVVTVFIMFTFVLSSGLGGGADFFDWLPRWLGQKSQKGDVMCSMDGSKVYWSELEKLRFNRVMANRFMNQAALYTRAGLDNYIDDQRERISPEANRVLDSIQQQERFLSAFGAQAPQAVQEMYFMLQRQIVNSPIARQEDKEVARVKQYSLSLLQALLAGGNDNHFFSSAPNRTNRDLVNFLLWQKKADQLGIKLTTDDVKRLIDMEFHSFFRGQSEVEVRKNLQRDMANFNLNRCIDAIGEEFRVRMAQVAVLGPVAHGNRPDKTFGGFPMFGTSYEAFDFYREQCSPTTYGAIPVPAVNFLSQVPEPDENDRKTRDELRDLFDKHKNDEPNLGRESPGLKEPRKIRVEWLAVTGTEPYYVKFAEELLKQGEAQARVGSMLTVPLLGASPMVMASATAPLAVPEPLVVAAYDRIIQEHKFSLSDRYNSANVTLARVMESSVVRPGVLVGAAGHSAGQALAFGHPLAALAGSATAPLAYELRDRVKTGLPAVLLGLGSIPAVKTDVLGLSIGHPVPGPLPGPALFANLMGANLAYEVMLPKPLPIDVVKPELMKNLTATTAKNIAFGEPVNPNRPAPATTPPKKGDLQTFVDEVNKLSDNGKVRPSDKDKFAALQKYIAEFAAKRGLTITGNKTPSSEWKLDEDPSLAALVAAQKESLKRSPHQQQEEYVPFANRFFWEQGDRRRPVSGIYKPDYYPEQRPQFRDPNREETKPQYLVWRTEEVPAKVPASFNDALPAVKAVWKHLKARELARARAEKLAETIRTGSASSEYTVNSQLLDHAKVLESEFENDPAAKDRIRSFHIQGVCPLTTVPNPTIFNGLIPSYTGPTPGPMREFQLPPSENVKYPSQEMGRKLLDERTKPVKTVLVLTDEPKDIYFVTTLMKREEKQSREFQNLLRQDASGNQRIVLGNYVGQGRDKTFASVLGLLKQEFKYEETDEQKKKLDERRGGD